MEFNSEKIVEALLKLADYEKNICLDESWYKEDIELCKRCGKLGWVMPSYIEDEDYIELKKINTDDELSDFFLEYYSKNNYENILKFKQNFFEVHSIDKFHKIYLEAYDAFEQKFFIASTITLIALFEGICVEIIFKQENVKNTLGSINNYLNRKYTEKTDITYGDRESLKEFVKILYRSIDFNSYTNEFNRNLIMHGRNFENICEKHCFQMFSAIDLLITLIEF